MTDPMLDGITRSTFFRTDEVVEHEKLPDDYDGLYTDEYARFSDLPALIARVREDERKDILLDIEEGWAPAAIAKIREDAVRTSRGNIGTAYRLGQRDILAELEKRGVGSVGYLKAVLDMD